MPYNNILYIGDEAKACLTVIEKFNNRLKEIEQVYNGMFINNSNHKINGALQHHIQFHFEGGIARFKFRNADDLPASIRTQCLSACNTLAAEQSFYAS